MNKSRIMGALSLFSILLSKTISSTIRFNITSNAPIVNDTQSSNRNPCIAPVHNIDRPIDRLENPSDAHQEKTFQRRPVQYGNFVLPPTFRFQTCYITLSLTPNCPRDQAKFAELAKAAETGFAECLDSVFSLYSGATVPLGRDRMILVVVHGGMITEDQLDRYLTSNHCQNQEAALVGHSSAPSVTEM